MCLTAILLQKQYCGTRHPGRRREPAITGGGHLLESHGPGRCELRFSGIAAIVASRRPGLGLMKYFLLLFLFTPAASEASCQESQSQDKEETTLSDHFGWNSKRGGVYVEIGALDGYQGSNTLMLHTCLDWTGVLVEGFKHNYDKLEQTLRKYRPTGAAAFYGAVCAPPQTSLTFSYRSSGSGDAAAGVMDFMAESFKSKFGYAGRGPQDSRSIETPCKPMADYLVDVPHVDFFSLDVEGSELEVLLTINFTKVTIDVMMVEFDGRDVQKEWKIDQLLRNVGFSKCTKVRVPRNAIFVRDASSLSQLCSG